MQTHGNIHGTDVQSPGPALNAYNNLHPLFGDTLVSPPPSDAPALPLECLLVIDSGFSHTTITPLYNGRPLQRAIRRLDFGGKHLTNLLKEIISVRYFDLHQDVKVVNDIKEDVCFVSQDFKADMEKTWKGNIGRPKTVKPRPRTPPDEDEDEDEDEDDTSDEDAMDTDDEVSDPPPDADQTLSIDYILPDGLHIKRGFARPHNPLATRVSNKNKRKLHASGPESSSDDDNYVSMTLSSERFTVPEILFSPSDTGSTQPGLAACVMQSLSVLPRALQASLLSNILVVGGNAKMPGLVQRVQREVRMLAPSEFVVRVRKMEDPVTSTWLGGARMAGNREVVRRVGVSRQEYFEHGSAWVGRRFGSGGSTAGGSGGIGK
jgi:actin-related protein 6